MLKWIQGGDLDSFVGQVKDRMAVKTTAEVPPTPVEDTADQIRKFAALRDEGLITEEECDAKRKQLLGL